jgi:biopolymer transport protein ExbB
VTAQDPDRGDTAARLAEVKGVPSVEELNALRALLMEEMVRSGQISRFSANVTLPDGTSRQEDVVRVGVFNLVSGDRFLNYIPETQTIQELARQPQNRYRGMAQALFEAGPGETVASAVDPSRGSLLALLIQSPSLKERIDQGGLVGYVIIALGIIGLLVALLRWLYLGAVGAKIRGQLKSEEVKDNNPLGRILKVYQDNQTIDTETLELKLDEAILREVPPLEKWQGSIKVIAAVAPLLGLLGTVTGMIATFQAITLFGTGDPKLMAGGISQALVTTVLGLVVAIPLVLLHSVVAGRSKALIEVLEEQSAGIIAKQSEAYR